MEETLNKIGSFFGLFVFCGFLILCVAILFGFFKNNPDKILKVILIAIGIVISTVIMVYIAAWLSF